jgi:hypothetical protein
MLAISNRKPLLSCKSSAIRLESGDQLSHMGAAPDIRQISCIVTPSCATA